jgi:large subunit ribosomal protein L6
MSRVGKNPITLSEKVKVNLTPERAEISGPLGNVKINIPKGIKVKSEDKKIIVERNDDSQQQRALHGLTRQLIFNAVYGVEKGYKKELDIVGVGYKATVEGKKVVFTIGYSHPIELAIPDGMKINVEKGTHITVEGSDKEMVGHISSLIRHFKKPDPYKGKGIMFTGERLIRKAGKQAK